MRAICLESSVPSPILVERDVPVPTPAPNELLVQVHAAGVTPTELSWYPTTHTKDGAARLNPVPGHEFSGVVAAVGGEASGFLVGQEVYGMNDWFSDGATAEYCTTLPSNIALKPARLNHAEAASVPIGALTAFQGLFDRAALRAGERVLIHGGAGAVGVFAIQLAKRAEAQVFTTASARHAEFLAQLGADHVTDYKTERFEEQFRDLDVIFDAVGGETLRRSWPVLKPGGRLVTIAAAGEEAQDERTKEAFFIVEPMHHQLAEISHLLDQGTLKTFVDGTVSLSQAATAYLRRARRLEGRGKVVVDLAPATL